MLTVVGVLVVAAPAMADLRGATDARTEVSDRASAPLPAPTGVMVQPLTAAPIDATAPTDAPSAIRALPALPSSVSLFLSAMLSVGAWQLIRSARQFDLAVLPDWYHAGGPEQVAGAVPYDLDLNLSALPVCFFAAIGHVEQPSVYRHVDVEITLPDPLWMTETDPRGPPARCV
jgi:hypothetical protein